MGTIVTAISLARRKLVDLGPGYGLQDCNHGSETVARLTTALSGVGFLIYVSVKRITYHFSHAWAPVDIIIISLILQGYGIIACTSRNSRLVQIFFYSHGTAFLNL